MSKKNSPLTYSLTERKLGGIATNAGQVVQQATASGRHRVSFERFCELVARDTTLNYMEVAMVLNLAADTARDLVANGDIVDFGRLGTLRPSFKSKVVPIGETFNPSVHITEPRVVLRPNATYFKLSASEVSYERVEPKPASRRLASKGEETSTSPSGGEATSPTPPEGGGSTGGRF